MQLAQLVVGSARGGPVAEPFACAKGLIQSIRPAAVQLHDLRAVHQALPAEGHQIGLSGAPVGQGGGPLLRTPQLEGHLAGLDRRAIHDSCDDRRQLTRRRRHHHLVQVCEGRRSPAEHDQRLSEAQPAERRHVRIAEALANPGGGAEEVACAGRVAARQPLQPRRHQQITPLCAVDGRLVEQPPGPSEPTAAARGLAAHQQLETQQNGAPSGAWSFTPVRPLGEGARRELVTDLVPASHVRSGDEQLQL
jgi:hypothetical protein